MPLIKIFFLLFRHDGGVCFFVGIYIYNICIWIMGKYLTFQSPQVLYFVLSHVSLGPQDSSVHGSRSKGCLAFRASQATVAACYGERYGPFRGMQSFFHQYDRYPLKTNECPLKIGHPQKGTIVFQPSIFGCELLVWKIVFFLAFTIFFMFTPQKTWDRFWPVLMTTCLAAILVYLYQFKGALGTNSTEKFLRTEPRVISVHKGFLSDWWKRNMFLPKWSDLF